MAVVIKCIVPDKKAVDAIRLLKPIALEPPVIDPLEDLALVGTNGKSPVRKLPVGTARQAVEDYVRKTHAKTLTATDLRTHVMQLGFGEHSYSYPLGLLIKRGILKKTKEPSTYEVVRK